MVKKIKPPRLAKPRYFVEVAAGDPSVTPGYCYRIIEKTGDGPEDYVVTKDWYGDYPSHSHANEAGRKWVMGHFAPDTGRVSPESEA